MTNRVQSLRSSIAGNRPSGRSPGELYVNFADAQLGVVNAGSTAQDLLPVRIFQASANYNVGDHVLQGGFIWRAIASVTAGSFNSAQWQQITPNALPLSGGTMTGDLILNRDPPSGASLQAATKQYVDGKTQTVTQVGPNLTIDYSLGRDCKLNLTAGITSVTIINWPATGVPGELRLTIVNAAAFTIVGWPVGTIWPSNATPVITPGSTDVIELCTDNGGGTIYGAAWQSYATPTAYIDGGVTGSASNASTISATLTTPHANDIIIALIHAEYGGGGSLTVTGISGGGLTWAQRSRYTFTDGWNNVMEVWWAAASAPLNTAPITVTTAPPSGQFDAATLTLIAVHGVASLSSPWDTNVSLPAKAQASATGLTTVPISTTATNSVVIGFAGDDSAVSGSPGAGFITLYNVFRAGPSLRSWSYSEYQIFKAAQTSYGAGVNGNNRIGIIFDALALP